MASRQVTNIPSTEAKTTEAGSLRRLALFHLAATTPTSSRARVGSKDTTNAGNKECFAKSLPTLHTTLASSCGKRILDPSTFEPRRPDSDDSNTCGKAHDDSEYNRTNEDVLRSAESRGDIPRTPTLSYKNRRLETRIEQSKRHQEVCHQQEQYHSCIHVLQKPTEITDALNMLTCVSQDIAQKMTMDPGDLTEALGQNDSSPSVSRNNASRDSTQKAEVKAKTYQADLE